MQERSVLLLNSSEEVLGVISWKKAITLLTSGKATKPYQYNHYYEIKCVDSVYKLPKAIILYRFVRVPYNDSQPSRKSIFKRDKWTCQYCGYKSKDPKKLTVDHVHPKSKGGPWSWTNLVTACSGCNIHKGSKTLSECKIKLKNKPKRPSKLMLEILAIDGNERVIWNRWIEIRNA